MKYIILTNYISIYINIQIYRYIYIKITAWIHKHEYFLHKVWYQILQHIWRSLITCLYLPWGQVVTPSACPPVPFTWDSLLHRSIGYLQGMALSHADVWYWHCSPPMKGKWLLRQIFHIGLFTLQVPKRKTNTLNEFNI